MSEIALLVPSRGRPRSINRLVQALYDTDTTRATLFVGLDDDDEQNYPRLPGVQYVVHERMNLAQWTNFLAAQLWDDFPILGSIGDDHVPRSHHWDEAVVMGLSNLPGIVFPDDGFFHEQLCTAAFWSAEFIKTLGYFCPPGFEHMYIDNVWYDLGQAIGRLSYLPSTLIEHMHPTAGKSQFDLSYRITNSQANLFRGKQQYDTYKKNGFEADVERLRTLLTD